MGRTTIFLLALAVTACAQNPSSKGDDPAEEGTTADPEDIITPTDFASLTLGGTVQGPLGPEVEASFVTEDGVALGDIASRVQCPEGVDPCDPETAEDGTIYTYIYEVRPGFDGPNDEPFPNPERVVPVESGQSFALNFPAHGFTGVAGYSVLDAQEILADGFNASISCEGDRLTWTLPAQSGWSTGETITFFWQSTQPPTGPDGEYRFVGDDMESTGMGPMPREGGEIAAVCE
ncbi:MAG: hypothetical protein HKN78_03340 [Sphingomonadaceae bacterium]|nr:hypothetical protein [Sphingomonadaceae bacterium]